MRDAADVIGWPLAGFVHSQVWVLRHWRAVGRTSLNLARAWEPLHRDTPVCRLLAESRQVMSDGSLRWLARSAFSATYLRARPVLALRAGRYTLLMRTLRPIRFARRYEYPFA